MKIILLEDEIQARQSLKRLIKLVYPEGNIVFESGRIDQTVHYLNNASADILFLDIELEDGNGFELLNQFPNRSFKVIITTAFDDRALQAYRSKAIDYLLKPINPVELKTSLDSAIHQIKLETLSSHQESILTLKTTNAILRIDTAEIIRLEADGAYTRFITKKSNILVSKNLQHYQNLLGPFYIRVHQSHLVRQDHIQLIKGSRLQLINGETIPISTRRKHLVLKSLK